MPSQQCNSSADPSARYSVGLHLVVSVSSKDSPSILIPVGRLELQKII